MRPSSLERISVDTTVQPKAITHPTDAKLYLKTLLALVRQAKRHRHELFRLAGMIDWERFEREFGRFYRQTGRPANPTRLMVGLSYLKHTFNFSDEAVVMRWTENPYWQRFCACEFFPHDLP